MKEFVQRTSLNERQLVDQLEDSITRLRSCLEENRVQETIARPDKVTARLENNGMHGLEGSESVFNYDNFPRYRPPNGYEIRSSISILTEGRRDAL